VFENVKHNNYPPLNLEKSGVRFFYIWVAQKQKEVLCPHKVNITSGLPSPFAFCSAIWDCTAFTKAKFGPESFGFAPAAFVA
jgi:hypothetical protein